MRTNQGHNELRKGTDDHFPTKKSTAKQKVENRKTSGMKRRPAHFCILPPLVIIQLVVMVCCGQQADGYLNHPPRFLIDGQTEIVLRLKEGDETPAGTLIYRLRGFDQDGDPLTFGVKELIGNEILRIEKSGKTEANVYLKKELDRETRDEYGLILTLTDGRLGEGNFITQSLLILVEDVNDNEPVFKQYQSTIVIPENSLPGIVTTVEATDRDEGTYGQVIYRLEESDGEDDVFSVSTVNGKGVIRLVKELDYEKKFLYQLKVLAVDRSNNERVNTGTAAIVIKVEDVEDQLPEFLVVSPVSRIREDAPLGTQVMRVKAVDGDRGVNNPISYSITKGALGAFEIDSTSGIVYTVQKLDRENPNTNNGAYILEITAEEDSKTLSPRPSIKTEVTIIVNDVNDEIPKFRSDFYEAEINENPQMNTPVTFLGGAIPEVYDHDQGNNGTFQLLLEGDHGIFEVTPSVGINEASFLIRVKDPTQLDYEKLTHLNFTLLAKETVTDNPKYSLVSVMVHVRDINDNVPKFKMNEYRVSVPENSKMGTTIVQIEAIDEDSGLYGMEGLRFTSLGGSIAEFLSLDSTTGVITITSDESLFDRELTDRHYLTVEVADDLGKGNRNTVQVIIDVEDVNDNAPKFFQTKYEARLLENHLNFESPLVVEAHDKDLNGTDNSKILYEIVEGINSDSFIIDPESGLIQPLHHIDFENLSATENDTQMSNDKSLSVKQIILVIRARDQGVPSLTSDVFVIVYLSDMNDHAPVFERSSYDVTVPEILPPETSIVRVVATDDDASSPNSDIVYRIQKGAKDKFVIDTETGIISLAPGASLDPDLTYPPTIKYSLTVLAIDGGFGVDKLQGSTEVNITIKDVNNKAPVFKEPGTVRIKENLNVGEYVYRVVAHDQDSDPILRYRLDKNASEARNEDGTFIKDTEIDFVDLFDLNSVNGMLRIKKQIDREKVETIRLALVCEDLAAINGVQEAFSVLNIIIEDVNDNSPLFRKSFYRRSITENSKNGIGVANVVADDRDKNRTIRYTFEGSKAITGLLHLDAETGEIVVANKIDHELTPWLNFSVRATDSGVPSRSSLVEVFVQVLDENDNNPHFLGDLTNITIREDTRVGTEIGKLEAIDADSGDFGRITYLLDRISSQGKFRIDAESGILSVADELDRETQDFYVLIVEAWDNYQFGYASGESRNAFKQIGVKIIDVNDEVPEFEEIESCVTVTEFHEVRETITVVKAFDNDDPLTPNGRILFAIVEGNGNSLFQIENLDYTTARITAAVPLKGFYGNYTLTVEAKDLGSPPNTVTTNVPICITDFNDNAPVFLHPARNVTVKIPENTTVGTSVIQVVAVDEDVGENGAVRYRLRKDPLGSWRTFVIDEETGVITLKLPLDKEQQKIHELRVEAFDLGVPTSLSSDLDLKIYVKNVNDFHPQFLMDQLVVNFTEHKTPGSEVRILPETIDKDDPDESDESKGEVCYFIVAGNENGAFTLDPLSHELRAKKELDREETDQYVMTVKASEDCLNVPGNFTTFDEEDNSVLTVTVKINDINDQSPKFVKKIFTGGVTTNSDFGTEFMRVKAIDKDEGRNGQIRYYRIGDVRMTVTEGMDRVQQQPFLVNEKTGSLYLNFYPQNDMKGYFQLTVLANDTGGLQDTAEVYIYLLRKDQRVRFVLRQHPSELRERIDKFRDGLKDITGAVVNIDEVKVHENKEGLVDNTKTDLYLHFVNQQDNSIIDVHDVLHIVDQNIEKLDGLFKDFNVLDTQPSEALRLTKEKESEHMMWLLGVIIFLGIMQILVLVLCFTQRSKYKRAIKAATATAFGLDQSNMDKPPRHVPNTNKHSVEGSNPIWMKGYENEWYKENDSLSQTSERDSLDSNAVVEDRQKPLNGISQKDSDNNNITYISTSHIMPVYEKGEAVAIGKENDLNITNYQKNLYQSLNAMANSLVAGKTMETTEL
ncbi:hypothetical protein RUM44_010591 [Polyplax serrata]|uniref:Cadherin domain-containing protein n=1 Tax=Polyplax serrata TaxID=468196 RepID=A0ABR1AVX6_POLSC